MIFIDRNLLQAYNGDTRLIENNSISGMLTKMHEYYESPLALLVTDLVYCLYYELFLPKEQLLDEYAPEVSQPMQEILSMLNNDLSLSDMDKELLVIYKQYRYRLTARMTPRDIDNLKKGILRHYNKNPQQAVQLLDIIAAFMTTDNKIVINTMPIPKVFFTGCGEAVLLVDGKTLRSPKPFTINVNPDHAVVSSKFNQLLKTINFAEKPTFYEGVEFILQLGRTAVPTDTFSPMTTVTFGNVVAQANIIDTYNDYPVSAYKANDNNFMCVEKNSVRENQQVLDNLLSQCTYTLVNSRASLLPKESLFIINIIRFLFMQDSRPTHNKWKYLAVVQAMTAEARYISKTCLRESRTTFLKKTLEVFIHTINNGLDDAAFDTDDSTQNASPLSASEAAEDNADESENSDTDALDDADTALDEAESNTEDTEDEPSDDDNAEDETPSDEEPADAEDSETESDDELDESSEDEQSSSLHTKWSTALNEFEAVGDDETINDFMAKVRVAELVETYKANPPEDLDPEALLLLNVWVRHWMFLASRRMTEEILSILGITKLV